MAEIAQLSSHRRLAVASTALRPDMAQGTRGTILDAALHLFAETGYGGTSVRDICARADVQPTTMYAHFPSKEHVLAEIVKIGHEEHLRALHEALLGAQPNAALQIGALVKAHVRVHCQYVMLSVVANAEMHALSVEAAAPALVLRKQAEGLLADVISRGIRQGVFNVPDPFLALAAIGGMGIRVAHWYSPATGKTVDEVAQGYAEIALRILGVKQGTEP